MIGKEKDPEWTDSYPGLVIHNRGRKWSRLHSEKNPKATNPGESKLWAKRIFRNWNAESLEIMPACEHQISKGGSSNYHPIEMAGAMLCHRFWYYHLHRRGILTKLCGWWVHTPGSSEDIKDKTKWYIIPQSEESTGTEGPTSRAQPHIRKARPEIMHGSKKTETRATFCLCL